MCMFTATASVQSTCLFASRQRERQTLVYQTSLETKKANAMLLPVPHVAGGSPITFIDLSSVPNLFVRLWHHFVAPPPGFVNLSSGSTLEVVRVGSFDASIVPTLADLSRLDRRFKLASGLRGTLGERYADHAFVVYRLAPGKQELHPFAFSWQSRHPDHLFFPTVHVHDGGQAPARATFHHELFAQGASLGERFIPLHRRQPLGQPAPDAGFPDFISPEVPLDYRRIAGEHENADVLVALDGSR
jgi:hypothetical protein